MLDLLITKDKEGVMNLSIGWANFVAAMPVFWKVVGCIVVGVGALWLLYRLLRAVWGRYVSPWAIPVWNQVCRPFRAIRAWFRRAEPRVDEFLERLEEMVRLLWATRIPRNIFYACLALGALTGIAIGMRVFLMDLLLPESKMRIYSSVVVGGLLFGTVVGIIASVSSRKYLKLYQRFVVFLVSPPVGGFILAPMCIIAFMGLGYD